MGGTAFQPKEFHVGRRINSADSIKFVVHLCSFVGRWLVMMIWQCVLASWVMCPKSDGRHPWYGLTCTIQAPFMFSFPAMPAVSPCFIHAYSHLLCHWATALNLTRAAKRLVPSAGSPFPSCDAVSRDPRVFCLGTTADIRTGPFQHNITSIDRHTGCRIWQVGIKTCGNLCFILHIGSRGCQRHGWTLHPHVSTCFEQEVRYVDGDRDTPQNHGSWVSRELWRREPEMINPGKSHAHRSWKNLKFQIFIHQNMPHWTATICCDCRWKTVFKTVVTSAEAPSLCRPWCPPRPSRPAAACRSPRGRWVLHSAAESNLSTADVGGTTRGGSAASELPGRARPGRPRPRPSPGERRRPPFRRSVLPRAARPRAPTRPRRLVGRGSAGRGAGGPAPPPGRRRQPRRRCSRLGARRKCGRNEVPQFLWSLCFIFSKSKSATYGNYIE